MKKKKINQKHQQTKERQATFKPNEEIKEEPVSQVPTIEQVPYDMQDIEAQRPTMSMPRRHDQASAFESPRKGPKYRENQMGPAEDLTQRLYGIASNQNLVPNISQTQNLPISNDPYQEFQGFVAYYPPIYGLLPGSFNLQPCIIQFENVQNAPQQPQIESEEFDFEEYRDLKPEWGQILGNHNLRPSQIIFRIQRMTPAKIRDVKNASMAQTIKAIIANAEKDKKLCAYLISKNILCD